MGKQRKKIQQAEEEADWKPEPPDPGLDVMKAHDHCRSNRTEIANSLTCGCFCCERIFPPAEVQNWLPNEGTAMCPYCDIDSVIGSASGFELTKDFMRRMHDFWLA